MGAVRVLWYVASVLAAIALLACVVVHSSHEVVLAEQAVAAAAAVVGGGGTAATGSASGGSMAARKAAQAEFEKGIPSIMRGLIDPVVDPCDNPHQWACGSFEKNLVIPKTKTSFSYSWDGDSQTILEHLHAIIEHNNGKPGFYYRACMDMPRIVALGTTPLHPWLAIANSAHNPTSLAIAVAKLHKAEIPVFFDWFVATDDLDSTKQLLYFDAGGLSLPDASYYTDDDKIKAHKDAFLSYQEKGLTLSGFNKELAAVIALSTLTIETELAVHKSDWADGAQMRYNATDLNTLTPNFDWPAYLKELGHADLTDDRLYVTNPAWFDALNSLLGKYKQGDIRSYLLSHVVMNVSPLLTEPFLDNNLDFDRDLYGVAARTERWKKCTRATRHALPFLVSQLFVQQYFPSSARSLALSMLETIREAFNEDLSQVPWMTNTTRVAAQAKLARIFFEVGYPEQWPAYGFLTMLNTYFDNAMRASEWRTLLKLERLRHGVSRRQWDVTPVSVNAFYYNGVNGVFMPTGILQPPFFDEHQPLAHNYGSIGAIMGHELTHGFDSTGAQYNANGERKDWWDEATLNEFDTRKQCVADYYSTFQVYGQNVDGTNTLDEDIADIGGLKMAYRAYLLAEAKRGRTPTLFDRRMFWTAFAQTWCGITRKQSMLVNMITDEHAPDKIRILGALSQNKMFARDFSCPVGSKMNPAKRCDLW